MIPAMTFFNILTVYKIIPFQHHYKEGTNKHQNMCMTHSAQDVCSHQVVNGMGKLMPSRGSIRIIN